jgi:hypothetical protein
MLQAAGPFDHVGFALWGVSSLNWPRRQGAAIFRFRQVFGVAGKKKAAG